MKEVFDKHKIVLDPHGAVGWKALELLRGGDKSPAVIYETADPGKFPIDVKRAIGITPELPKGMKLQQESKERIFSIDSAPNKISGALKLSDTQISEAKEKIEKLFS
jgi:threonine synthase